MSQQQKIGVFVIAYNAESHIARTLARIPRDLWERVEDVFLIDDCSTDETVSLALSLVADYPKLKVIRNRTNQRYGGNQKVGFQYAIDQGHDLVVMLHADGQYAPELLPQMLEPLLEDRADIVLGSRLVRKREALQGGMPRYKFFGNIILTRLQNLLSGMSLHEFHTGYRAYSTAFLKSVPFWDNTDEWHFDTEILLQGFSRQARIVEIPIPTYYGDEICHVNGMAYAFNCIRTSLRHAFHRRGICYSRNFDLNASGSKYSSKFQDPYSSHTLLYRRLEQSGLAEKTVLELGVGDCSLTRRLHAGGRWWTASSWTPPRPWRRSPTPAGYGTRVSASPASIKSASATTSSLPPTSSSI
jgi:glycosyltransferase involved in cell wall biosynthesis